MIDTGDIRAAVGSGLISERQAASLTALAQSRRGAREDLSPGDEPFELFRGFNEIFIVVGLVILSAGWAAVVSAFVAADPLALRSTLMIASIVSAAAVWLLSEYFIRRRRMIGPAILLSVLFTAVTAFGFAQWLAQVFMVAQEDYSSLVIPGLLTTGATFLYWLRFRVPFSMALIALMLFATALIAAATRAGTPDSVQEIFVFSAEGSLAWVTLALGLAAFAVAMLFDASDPHRVTRRSAQGFWLHLVAAPMIINTVALSILGSNHDMASTALIAVMALFALVAIVIDRRSFLLAAIVYVVTVIATLSRGLDQSGFAWLILALGVFLVLLGAFWARIRAALLSILPLGPAKRWLPPAHSLERPA